MKRYCLIFLAVVLSFSIAGCKNSTDPIDESGTIDNLTYTKSAKSFDGTSTHYHLTNAFDSAEAILNAKYGSPNMPGLGGYWAGSTISETSPVGSVIYEVVAGVNPHRRLFLKLPGNDWSHIVGWM